MSWYLAGLETAGKEKEENWTKTVSHYALKEMPALGRAVIERPDQTQVAAQLGVPTVVIHGEDDAGHLAV